ncbi:hypothetical protein A3A56_01620 [Candidatus Roizmanbacteria bacterium RIFCSPLOWO2_01_FULL_40_32]|nr:MAG: hypothetical protein A3A56_01620 [Candidatus Roizmanbacteria bacterium RIFCSPLOWO2_01_FULL_40_32]
MEFIDETLSVFMQPLFDLLKPLRTKHVDQLIDYILLPFPWGFRKLGLLKYHDEIEKAPTDRTKVIWNEAKKRGIEMQGITFLGKPLEHHRAKIKGKWESFESLPIPPYLNIDSYMWMDDKAQLKTFFNKNTIPTPSGKNATTQREALNIFKRGTAPFIVKPQAGSRGRHTTTHIYTEDEMITAFKSAKKLCHFVIVEEQLMGSIYRATYINGKVVGVVRGDPPRIIGDGKHMVKELIVLKNMSKHKKVNDVLINQNLQYFLKRQQVTLQSILEKGRILDLSEKIGISYGGFAAEEFPKTHPKIIQKIKEAGDLLNAPIIGFDVIIEDITADPKSQRWGIIEANSLPFIDLHHFPLEGKSINVASLVWDLWS